MDGPFLKKFTGTIESTSDKNTALLHQARKVGSGTDPGGDFGQWS
jgi:hypothetical protein